MRDWLVRQWYSPQSQTRLSVILWLSLIPLSYLYAALIKLRRYLYRHGYLASYAVPVPVLVIGNITVGGTGKTPLVIYLVQALRQLGYTPGVISRGYGGKQQGAQAVDANSDPQAVGDEPVLIARRTQAPIFVAKKRVLAARTLLQAHPECNILISDDGLQHYALRRDFEIAVVDGERGLGNGYLLPAGPLRESASRLSEMDAVIMNGHAKHALPVASVQMHLQASSFINVYDASLRCDVKPWSGLKLHAIAGIGNPARFFSQLQNMGFNIECHAFADHHAFQAQDLAAFADDIVLMTEKDAVKCAAFARPNHWYLPINAELDAPLLQQLQAALQKIAQ
jgi:tetraacyldisaccharide 4'-kinase